MRKIQPVDGIRNQLDLSEYLGAFGYAGPQDIKPSIFSVGSNRPKSYGLKSKSWVKGGR